MYQCSVADHCKKQFFSCLISTSLTMFRPFFGRVEYGPTPRCDPGGSLSNDAVPKMNWLSPAQRSSLLVGALYSAKWKEQIWSGRSWPKWDWTSALRWKQTQLANISLIFARSRNECFYRLIKLNSRYQGNVITWATTGAPRRTPLPLNWG
jgi:hypothetical protein